MLKNLKMELDNDISYEKLLFHLSTDDMMNLSSDNVLSVSILHSSLLAKSKEPFYDRNGQICLSSDLFMERYMYHLVDHSTLPLRKTTTLLRILGQPALVDQIMVSGCNLI